jgi:hypothetical protein
MLLQPQTFLRTPARDSDSDWKAYCMHSIYNEGDIYSIAFFLPIISSKSLG